LQIEAGEGVETAINQMKEEKVCGAIVSDTARSWGGLVKGGG